jgi:hypothetical protein
LHTIKADQFRAVGEIGADKASTGTLFVVWLPARLLGLPERVVTCSVPRASRPILRASADASPLQAPRWRNVVDQACGRSVT